MGISILLPNVPPSIDVATWDFVAEDFENFLRTSGKANTTVCSYLRLAAVFWLDLSALGINPIAASRQDVRARFARRQNAVKQRSPDQRLKIGSIYKELYSIRAFYAFVIDQGWRIDNPTDAVELPRREKPVPKDPFALEELQKLDEACLLGRDQLMFQMFSDTGIRVSEFCGQNVDDIDWQLGRIKIRGKGAKERWAIPSPDLLYWLRIYIRNDKGPVWLTKQGTRLTRELVCQNMHRIAKRAGVSNVHPHRFRAHFALRLLEAGGDLDAVQSLLGHDNISTTAVYTAHSKEERGFKLVRRLHGIDANSDNKVAESKPPRLSVDRERPTELHSTGEVNTVPTHEYEGHASRNAVAYSSGNVVSTRPGTTGRAQQAISQQPAISPTPLYDGERDLFGCWLKSHSGVAEYGAQCTKHPPIRDMLAKQQQDALYEDTGLTRTRQGIFNRCQQLRIPTRGKLGPPVRTTPESRREKDRLRWSRWIEKVKKEPARYEAYLRARRVGYWKDFQIPSYALVDNNAMEAQLP